MTAFEFRKLGKSKSPGTVLYSTSGTPPTGVYLPPKHPEKNSSLNVVLWLHGFYDQDLFTFLGDDGTHVLKSVSDSNQDVVLIAPWLGFGYTADYAAEHKDMKYGGKPLESKGQQLDAASENRVGPKYLGQVLDGLSQWLQKNSGAQAPTSPLKIDRLFVACHSAGGGAMILAVDALSADKSNTLKECWGFDCLYPNAKWESFFQSHTNLDLYFYNGGGTQGAGARKQIFGLSQLVYDSKPASVRRVLLAPAFDKVGIDKLPIGGPASKVPLYEQFRNDLDPYLGSGAKDANEKYWKEFNKNGYAGKLMSHYGVPQNLLTPRIVAAMSKP